MYQNAITMVNDTLKFWDPIENNGATSESF